MQTQTTTQTPWRRGYRDASFFPAAAGRMVFPGSPYQPWSNDHIKYVLGALDYAQDHDLVFASDVAERVA